jgi:hypothetical protein
MFSVGSGPLPSENTQSDICERQRSHVEKRKNMQKITMLEAHK